MVNSDTSSDDKVTTEEGKRGHIILPNFAGDPIIDYPPPKLSKEKIEKMITNIHGSKEEGERADQQEASESDTAAEKNATAKESSSDSATEDGESSDHTAESIETDSESATTDFQEESSSSQGHDNSTDSSTAAASEGEQQEEEQPKQIKLVDYASKMAGAQILEQSPSLKGASNLLTGDKDKYSISPCEDKKYIVIGLSEDILVKQIKLSNYERYSSRVQDFQVLASQEYPTPNEEYWTNIGTYTAHSKSGEQSFDLDEPSWARYLKFRFLSHYGSEHYCTLSQIKVHGSTMLQGFHEQWIESEKDVVDDGAVNESEEEEHEYEEEGQEQEEVVDSENGDAEEESVNDQDQKDEVDADIPPQGDEEGDTMEKKEEQDVEIDETEGEDKNVGVERENVEESPADGASDEQAEETTTQSAVDETDKDDEMEQTARIKTEDKLDTKDDSVQDTAVDTIETKASEEEEAKSDGEEEASDYKPLPDGGDIDKKSSVADSEGSDKEEASIEIEETGAKTAAESDDDGEDSSTSEPLDEHSQDTEEEDNQNASHDKDDETVITNEENPVQDNSSIAAVTDVVKAVVVDASGVIKNATSDAIKAIRTTVGTTSEDIADSDKEAENATLDRGKPGDGDIQEENKEQEESKTQQPTETAKQNNTSTVEKTSDARSDTPKTPSQLKGDVSNDNIKQKVGDGSAKADFKAVDEVKPEKSKHTQKESPKATSTSRDLLRRGAITHTSKDTGELYTKLARRFPHAACIKDLDFQAFKSKTMLANAERSGGSTMGGGPGKMEPIFAKITNEIKNVQITQNQYEQYLSALKTCYESLFYDMAKDLDSTQADIDHRLASLERAVFLSEMNTKGGRRNNASSSTTNDLLSRTNFPFTMSAFQFSVPVYVMPTLQEHAQEIGIVLGSLMLLAMLLLRGKKNTAHSSAPSKPTEFHTPERSSLMENKLDETKRKLADTDEKYKSLHGKYATLQSEHASLQQRYSQLVASLENEAAGHQTPRREVHHVIPSDTENCYSTPSPSIQGRGKKEASTEELPPKNKKNTQCPSTIS